MTRTMPQIREFMTRSPKTVASNTSLDAVHSLMKQGGIRHLPVEKSGRMVGIISERNVQAALLHSHSERLAAEDVMIPDPFVVPPHAELDLVASAMAEEKFGCAIVQEEGGAVVGIFTTVDACRALCQVLETHYPT